MKKKMRRCEDEKCEDEKMWWEDVKMWRWEDEKMWRREDVKRRRWEDVKMRRCEDEKLWRWEDVKMRWEDVKMRRCEDIRWQDVKMWRWEGAKMRRCEDEKMWRYKMTRCEDVTMFEDVYNRPPLLEKPFAQTLSGKIHSKSKTKESVHLCTSIEKSDCSTTPTMNSLWKQPSERWQRYATIVAGLLQKKAATFSWSWQESLHTCWNNT